MGASYSLTRREGQAADAGQKSAGNGDPNVRELEPHHRLAAADGSVPGRSV